MTALRPATTMVVVSHQGEFAPPESGKFDHVSPFKGQVSPRFFSAVNRVSSPHKIAVSPT